MTAAEPESRPVRPPPGRPGRRKGPAPVPRPSARRTAPRRGPNPTARNRPLPLRRTGEQLHPGPGRRLPRSQKHTPLQQRLATGDAGQGQETTDHPPHAAASSTIGAAERAATRPGGCASGSVFRWVSVRISFKCRPSDSSLTGSKARWPGFAPGRGSGWFPACSSASLSGPRLLPIRGSTLPRRCSSRPC